MMMSSAFRVPDSAKALTNVPVTAICAYAAALALSWGVYDLVAERKWSSIMTMSGVAHCLGLVLLCIQMAVTRSAAGISARALVLDGVALSLRLSSTLFYQGYLPNDKSGDCVFQCIDLCSLVLVVFLLRSVLFTRRSTYQVEDDDMSIGALVVGCLCLGALLHGDMDDHPIFDSLWLASLFVSIVAVLPQYWMISKSSGQVHVLTAHYIAATAVDRALSGLFMWYVRKYITCIPWFGEFQHTIYTILLAHLIHLVLLSDFAFFYTRAVVARAGSSSISLISQGYDV
jgi:hypothetical protein